MNEPKSSRPFKKLSKPSVYFIPYRDPDGPNAYKPYISYEEHKSREFFPGFLYTPKEISKSGIPIPGEWIIVNTNCVKKISQNYFPNKFLDWWAKYGADRDFYVIAHDYKPSSPEDSIRYSAQNLNLCG